MSDIARVLALLDTAASEPEQANLGDLWHQFNELYPQLSLKMQLQLGGEVMERLAKLYEAKATLWFDDWEEGNNTEGPCFTDEMLQGLVRQTQTVDVSSLAHESRLSSGRSHAKGESIAGEVDKAKILAVVNDLAIEETAMVAHDETVSGWVSAVAEQMRHLDLPIPLLQLHQLLDLSLIQLWLALLLGDYQLEQRGEFYDISDIWVY